MVRCCDDVAFYIPGVNNVQIILIPSFKIIFFHVLFTEIYSNYDWKCMAIQLSISLRDGDSCAIATLTVALAYELKLRYIPHC